MLNYPKEYQEFLEKYGVISQNGVEIYGLKDGLNNESIPSVIGATKLYKKDYDIKDDEIVIAFDDFKNSLVILNSNNELYLIDLDGKKEKIANSFNKFLEQKLKEIGENN